VPQLERQGVIVRNLFSLISAGTERAQVEMDRRSLIGKARARPDLVRQVLQKVRSDGLKNTFRAVQNKLTTPTPLGYSSAGTVLEVGDMVPGIRAGDIVACSGGGYANHAEAIYVPRNLAAPLPPGLDPKVAATAGVGAIALQGVRQSGARLGELVAVIGLGLIGQMTCQLLRAAGCRIVGIDIDPRALEHTAKHMPGGTYLEFDREQAVARISDLTGGLGADASIICATTKSPEPVELSAEITREQGTVSAVGLVNLDIPREAFYRKELKLVVSRSLGPGRYDPAYEEHGLDYPAAYVRWTEGRNMAAWLQLASDGEIEPAALISHTYDFEDAVEAYNLITDGKEYFLGVLLRYDAEKEHPRAPVVFTTGSSKRSERTPAIGAVGVGTYASKFLLPYLKGGCLRGVASGSGLSAVNAAKRFGFAFAAGDPQQVISDAETDAVIIATRHNLHGGLTVEALKAGKAVFVEKPLCLTIEELRAIVDAHGDEGFLHVGFNRRFAPAVELARKHIEGSGPAVLLCRVNAGLLQGHWLQDPLIGGGRILGEGCHFIDLLRLFAGSPIVRVTSSALRTKGKSAVESEDVSISLEFESGSVGTVIYTGSGSKALPKERYELFAGGRSAVIEDYRVVELYSGGKTRNRLRGRDTGQAGQMRRFVEGLNTGEPPIPFRQIIETTLATFAAVESIARNAPVTMEEMWSHLEDGR